MSNQSQSHKTNPDTVHDPNRQHNKSSTPAQQNNETQTCTECGGPLQNEAHETVCQNCGLVMSATPIDHGPEWRHFQDDETNPRRTGPPRTPARHDNGLSTTIGFRGSFDTSFSDSKLRQLSRLRREHRRSKASSKREQNQRRALIEIKHIISQLDLPSSVRTQSSQLFKTAQQKDLLRGRSVDGFAAAVVYATCRLNDLSRTRAEITAASLSSLTQLTNAYDALNTSLPLPTGPINPADYVRRFASELGLSSHIAEQAFTLTTTVHTETRITQAGKKPTGVAAACIYLTAHYLDEPVTHEQVAKHCGVSSKTLRRRRQDITGTFTISECFTTD